MTLFTDTVYIHIYIYIWRMNKGYRMDKGDFFVITIYIYIYIYIHI